MHFNNQALKCKTLGGVVVFGVSLSEPHINGYRMRDFCLYVCMYVCFTSDDAGHRGASLGEQLTDLLILIGYLPSLLRQSVANCTEREALCAKNS